jgi:hypothetical protein
MTQEPTSHWTDDDALLGRFVLGAVPSADRPALDAHLAGCEQCRKAVETERLLAAGVRRLGRDQLKRSLAERLRVHPPVTHPWPRILAAAAIVVIAGGVALYSRWITLQHEQPELPDRSADSAHSGSPPAAQLPSQPEHTPPAGSPKKDARISTPKEKGSARNMEAATTGTVAEEVQQEMAGKATANTPAVTGLQGVGTPSPVEWWTGRHVTPGGQGDSLMSDLNPAAPGERGQFKSHESPAMKTRQTYVIDQRPVEDLRRLRSAPGGLSPETEILISVERRGGLVYLTLYTSPLFRQSDVATATVRESGPDSLLIEIGGTMIGAHPPGR